MTNAVSFNTDGVVLDAFGVGAPVSHVPRGTSSVADTVGHTASFILE
jgi:hypothetical protein